MMKRNFIVLCLFLINHSTIHKVQCNQSSSIRLCSDDEKSNCNDNNENENTPLQIARTLLPPEPSSIENGEVEGYEFWEQHSDLLRQAWKQWETTQHLPYLNPEELLDNTFQQLVHSAWKNPRQYESKIKSHMIKVAPNVYSFQLFKPEYIYKIRQYIDNASLSNIPIRRPNGMNRYGMIIHPIDNTVDGSVALTGLEEFYNQLIDYYVRPLGRLLFKKFVGIEDDIESYAFTIRYKYGEDIALNEHTDASLITLNVNLNTIDEEYSGSSLYFLSEHDSQQYNVTMEPGTALIHLGRIRHAAVPIDNGERTNLVIWLHGKYHYVRMAPYALKDQLTIKQRWSTVHNDNGIIHDDPGRNTFMQSFTEL